MPRPPRQPATPTPLVPALLRYAAARGLDATALAARLALPADAAARDDVAVEPRVIGELVEALATQLAEPYLALRLPGELPLRSYALGEVAARAAATLRDSLRLLAPLVHPAMACELVEGGGAELAEWRQATPHDPRGVGRYAHEYALAYVLTHARAVLGAPLPIARAWFAHARPRAIEPLARWLGCGELAFGAVDTGVAFARGELDRALVTADPRLAATVSELAPRVAPAPPVATSGELAARVAAIVRARLPEPTTADDAAALLHLSARTLQRRLEAEATTFSAVFDAAREALARELLADAALPLGEIAYRLGFADAATFSRSFKRWIGSPPGRFRSALS